MDISNATLCGAIPAIATPFTADGSAVDTKSLDRLVEHVLSNGCSGLVVCGSTGEAITLSDDEYRSTVARVSSAVRSGGKGFCIAGIGTSNTARAAQIAKELGKTVDGILLVTPPYNKPSQEGIIEHFKAVHVAASAPIIAYNVPGRTGVNLLPKTVAALVSSKLIIGLKESSGSIDEVTDICAEVGTSIAVLSGEDSLLLPTLALGGRGIITVTGNVIPDQVAGLVAAAFANHWEEARRLQFATLPLTRALFMETNPIPVKAALAIKRIIDHPTVRLPLMLAQTETVSRLTTLLES